MKSQLPDHDPLFTQLKQLIVARFRVNSVTTDGLTRDEPLIGGRLGLDSLDALELGLQVEEIYGCVPVSAEESHRAFATLGSLADYIRQHAPSHCHAA